MFCKTLLSLWFISLCFSLPAGLSAAGQSPAEMNTIADPPVDQIIAVTGGRLIDGNGGPPIDDCTVVIRGNQIQRVGKDIDISGIDPASIVHASGLSILPGLFDSHFHSRDTLVTPVTYELENGITSFRDPGHPLKYYQRLLASDKTIPRVFLCGGHLDADPVVWPDQAVTIGSSQDAIDAVNSHVDRGASAIKIYFRLPIQHVAATCTAAAARNVPVTAHLELVDAEDAIRVGVIGIEHITSFGTTIAPPDAVAKFKEVVTADSAARRIWRHRLWSQIEIDGNDRLEALIDLIIRRGVFVSPTLAIYEAQDSDPKADPERVAGFRNMLAVFGKLHTAGAKVVVGSHTAAPYADKGKAYLREIQLMSDAGMSASDIIVAATKTNAQFFGVEDRLGTIEPGKLADLVLVDGDPSTDIDAIDRVRKVMLGGRWVIEKD